MRSYLVIPAIALGIILFSTTANAQSSAIPDWIKNTAAWWAEGAVGDSDYINSLQWLINEGLIEIPQAEKTAEPEKQYLTKKFKFSMWQPENWERQQELPDPLTGLTISSMVESSMITQLDATNISVIIEDMSGLSLEDYNDIASRYVEDLYGAQNIEIFDSGLTTIQGERAYWEISTLDLGIMLKSKQYLIEHRGEVFVVTYNTAEKNFDKHLDQFEEIMDTFKFL